MNLNRKQLSLLITVFSMGIMVLGLYNLHLGKAGAEEDEAGRRRYRRIAEGKGGFGRNGQI